MDESDMDRPTEMNLEGNVAAWIWNNLVPQSGQADTVQGELLRAVEKLCWEAQNNRNGNWDSGYETLLGFLRSTLLGEKRLDESTLEAVTKDLNRLEIYNHPYVKDDLYDRLTDAVIAYCHVNPLLTPRENDPGLLR